MSRAFIAALAVFVAGCGQTSDAAAPTADRPKQQSVSDFQTGEPVAVNRYTLRRVQTVWDSSAYGNTRGVYILHDTKTGREWIGVSGVGLSELGSHQAGKVRHQDER